MSILFDWDSRERFQAFLDDPEVKDSMRAGGELASRDATRRDATRACISPHSQLR